MVSGSGKDESKATNPTNSKGAALIIDYDDEHAFGSSFRAFRDHRHVNVFD
ncbi:hypothetical protein JB92DRAFT_2926705, partial [Gautieria morchelliformis]